MGTESRSWGEGQSEKGGGEAGVISILVVDDVQPIRQCLRTLVEESAHLHVVGEAADGLTATQLVEALRPEVVLMDVHMGRLDGVTATQRIKAIIPQTLVIGLTAFPNPLVHEPMLRAGAYTTIGKDRLDEQLLTTIEHAFHSESS